MIKRFQKKIKGDRKYFSIVFFVLLLIPISGIFTNNILEKTKSDWFDILNRKISELQLSIQDDFNSEQDRLLNTLKNIKSELVKNISNSEETYKTFVEILNDKKFNKYSLELFAPNGKLVAWSKSVAINQNELFPLAVPVGETYFLEKPLIYYLSIIDTLHFDSDVFYLTVSFPIERKYSLVNPYFINENFSSLCVKKYNLECNVDYNPFSSSTKDGKKFSFELLNNKGKKIGLITINKPTLVNELNAIKETSAILQAFLVILAFILIGIALRSDFKKLSSLRVKFTLFTIYLALFRIILFWLDIPSRLISGALVDPANFSSTFSFGIVKSPIEFLITNIFISAIAIQFFRYTFISLINYKIKIKTVFRISLTILILPIIFLLIRGLSASIRSVIFDSKLRYFKDPEIIPDLTLLVMDLNVLLIAFAVIACVVGFISIIFFLNNFNKEGKKKNYILYYLPITVSVILFYFLSKEPLINLFLLAVFLFLILITHYYLANRAKKSVFNYLLILLCASIISVSLLNFFNTKLERESLKTTAFELNRIDDNLIRFYLSEVLENDLKYESIFTRKDLNLNAIAFIEWSKSIFQRESMNSFVSFYDRFGIQNGEFAVGLKSPEKISDRKISLTDDIFFYNQSLNEVEKNIIAIKRVSDSGITKGFVSAGLNFNISKIGASDFPDFLESDLSIFNQVLNIKQLKIFLFLNGEMIQVYGEIFPSREQIKLILNTPLNSTFNDAWTKINFSGENYETYILKNYENGNEILTVVSVADKEFSWNLFNFFKVFFIHVLFILLIILLFLFVRIGKINLTFRGKILIAFLLVSIIPVIILAAYNRQIVDERAKESIFNELKQRADYIQNHIVGQIKNNRNRNIIQAGLNASNELKISFSLYEGTEQIFNSNETYNKIGLFDTKLNSDAYYNLHYLRFREYLSKERIHNYYYDSYYRQIKINNKEYILAVNDAFNKIKVPFSTTEIDVVIFGIYSFAVLLIVIFSTFFANQISSPIQKLTKATEAVGKGDLNVQIIHNAKGEIKDLLDGFNQMTQELKKNQMELAELEREIAWKEMAKQVAHEIKNPLTPMKLALQQLIAAYRDKRTDFDKQFDKISSTILNQIENLSQIASEFSRFAKMPSLKIEVIDLIKVINDTINIFVNEQIKISFISEFDQAWIEADANNLSRMFINFIRNSIQASAKKIEIRIFKNEDNYEILIIDDGHGINPEIRDKIFNKNFTTKAQGMGLGLSIAKRFIENINGKIYLHATSEKGTTFRVIIPVYYKK